VNKLAILVLVIATACAVPAQAKPPKPPKSHEKPGKCEPRLGGFHASGTLVSQSLTQVAGADTEKRSDDRYSGDVTVNVTKAGHGVPTGEQTYTLDADRVKFYDANHDHMADMPVAGDRVKVKGKATRLKKKCDASEFTPTIDVRSVHFKPAKPAEHAKHAKPAKPDDD
jgi:hypothetical protein